MVPRNGRVNVNDESVADDKYCDIVYEDDDDDVEPMERLSLVISVVHEANLREQSWGSNG